MKMVGLAPLGPPYNYVLGLAGDHNLVNWALKFDRIICYNCWKYSVKRALRGMVL